MKTNSISTRIVTLVMVLVMALTLAACGTGTAGVPVSDTDTAVVTDGTDVSIIPETVPVGEDIPDAPEPMTDANSTIATKGQVVELIYKAAGSPKATDSVSWAKANGIITDSRFNASSQAYKIDVICYLWRYAGKPASTNQTKIGNLGRQAENGKAAAWALDNKLIDATLTTNQRCTYDQAIAYVEAASAAINGKTQQTGTNGPKVDEKTLKLYGEITTMVKSTGNPTKPNASNKHTGSYGTMDWSTKEQGYVTFTPSVDNHRIYLLAPDGEYTLIADTVKNQPMKIALLEGTGTYQYVVATADRVVKYKNSFTVNTFDAQLANYLVSTPFGDYENAPNAVAKANDLWDNNKNQLDNVKALAQYVGDLDYDLTLSSEGSMHYVNPDTVIKNGGGVCNEMSKLLIAMLRSKGIPAHYQTGNGGSHAWVMAWVELDSSTADGVTTSRGTWVLIEATLGKIMHTAELGNGYKPDRLSVN